MEIHTFVILLNFHGCSDTIECIHSLLQLKNQLTILVVDNSIGDEEWQSLIHYSLSTQKKILSFDQENIPVYSNEKIVLIKAKENKGFAAGNNIGIHYSMKQKECSHLWILNNDTVVEEQSLDALINQHLQNPKTLLGSKLLYYKQPTVIQAVGGVFNTGLYISQHIGEGLAINTSKSSLPPIEYPIGASMFMSRKFIEEVGVLCEDFFLYYEELDWVYRSKEKGYTIDWCENSHIYHKEGASIGSSYKNRKSYFSEVNLFASRKIFVKKHLGLNAKFYISTLLLIGNRFRKGQFKLGITLLKQTLNGYK